MKYAFLFITLILTLSNPSFARTITSFNDSQALMTVAQFILDNAEDLATSSRISDKKLKIKDDSACEPVNKKQVLKEVERAIYGIMRLYPDEELPIEEAMMDLEDYLGNGSFKKCLFSQKNQHKLIQVSYFFNSAHNAQVRVDTITLLLL